MKLNLVSIEKGGIIRVGAEGKITADDLLLHGVNPLQSLMGSTWASNKVLLDFERVHYIDSSAVGWLISSHKEFKSAGGAMVVHSIQPTVKQILDLLKIGRVVPMADDEAAARALIGVAGPEST